MGIPVDRKPERAVQEKIRDHSVRLCSVISSLAYQKKIRKSAGEFEAHEKPNVVTAPMPKHGVNVIEEDLFVASVDDIVTPIDDLQEEPVASRFISGIW